jgi:hypothetical protein
MLRWLRQKFAQLALPDYGTRQQLPNVTVEPDRDYAFDLPESINFLAGGAADWPDPVFVLDPNGHHKTRICPAAIRSINKLSKRTGKLDWQVRGGNAKRRAQFKEILQHTIGFGDMIDWITWALFEGVRYVQIKTHSDGKWIVPTFKGGGRLKFKAGGRIHFDGTRLIQVLSHSMYQIEESRQLPRDQFIMHRPGAGSSPEGDMDLGVAVYNLCDGWWDGLIGAKLYAKIYGVPWQIVESDLRRARADRVQDLMKQAAARLADQQERQPGTAPIISLNLDNKVKLLQPATNGMADLWSHLDKLSGTIDQMIILTKLTNDVSDAVGGVGSSGVALSEELVAALCNGMQCAESLNMDLIPWIATRNDGELEPLADGETECYLWPMPPNTGDAGDMENDGNDPEDPEGGEEDDTETPDPNRKTNPETPSVNRLFGTPTMNQLRSDAVVLPPVHPHCECQIIGGRWIDSGKASVCPECRAYGSAFNAMNDAGVEPTEEQADVMADARNSQEFKAAIARDTAAEERIIRRAAKNDQDGIVARVVREMPKGAPVREAVERRIEAALIESRASAEVKVGTKVRGKPIPEAITSRPLPADDRFIVPEFVSAVAVTGQRYTIIKRLGRYHIIDRARDRIIDSDDSLLLLLLFFYVLEEMTDEESDKQNAA